MRTYKLFAAIIAFIWVFSTTTAQAQLAMPVTSNEGIEAKVRELFFDSPEMIAVAKCESGYRQYAANGSVLGGGTGGRYVGVFQISMGHIGTAQSMGLDIYTTEGNLAYARYLYLKQGTRPWLGCLTGPVAPPPAASTATTSVPLSVATSTPATTTAEVAVPIAVSIPVTAPVTGSLTVNLKLGMAHPQVLTVQQMLNAAGFTIAASGPGSPGNETTMFGSLTRQAVQRFQCAKGLVCSGNEATTGYGRVGPGTRAALMAGR